MFIFSIQIDLFAHQNQDTMAQISGHNVSQKTADDFKAKDVELTVPPGAPRPVLIIVMVSRYCFYAVGSLREGFPSG